MPSEEAEPTIEEISGYLLGVTRALAQSHGICALLIARLQDTELSSAQKEIIAEASKALAKSQNEFFKTFGNWNEPGNN